jgi:hypothetical protein
MLAQLLLDGESFNRARTCKASFPGFRACELLSTYRAGIPNAFSGRCGDNKRVHGLSVMTCGSSHLFDRRVGDISKSIGGFKSVYAFKFSNLELAGIISELKTAV